MSLQQFARNELERAGMFDPDADYGGELGNAVMRLVDVFADEGHSGGSAMQAISLFERLARFEPITPLTGDDSEWTEVAEQNGGPLYQSRRCSHVFKDPLGAYTISRDKREEITFPYTPE